MRVAETTPDRDDRWDSSEPQLVAAIRDEILAAPGRRITFARFMERVLTEPGIGYYASSELRPTRGGDFLTAPELHPFFGRCLARFIEGAWRRAGSPSRYLVREYGAGRGALRESAMAGLLADGSPLAGSVDWQAVDLPGRTAATEEPADLVLANEYLDALPVHRLRQAGSLQRGLGRLAGRLVLRGSWLSPRTRPSRLTWSRRASSCARGSERRSAWRRRAG